MTALSFTRLCLPIAVAAALAVASTSFAPPLPKGKENVNDRPDTEEAKAAVDYSKVATDGKVALKERQARIASSKNLQQLALAAHNYHDQHSLLPSDVVDKKGKAILSWRVRLLPFLEQKALYEKFKLDEPWDSKHNKKLLAE